jgi:hypothetical protein
LAAAHCPPLLAATGATLWNSSSFSSRGIVLVRSCVRACVRVGGCVPCLVCVCVLFVCVSVFVPLPLLRVPPSPLLVRLSTWNPAHNIVLHARPSTAMAAAASDGTALRAVFDRDRQRFLDAVLSDWISSELCERARRRRRMRRGRRNSCAVCGLMSHGPVCYEYTLITPALPHTRARAPVVSPPHSLPSHSLSTQMDCTSSSPMRRS